MKTKNCVEARGKIVKVKNGGLGYGAITLLVKVGPKESVITFTLANAINPDISIGDIVEIKGHIRSTGTYTDDNGKRRSDQFFVADSVKPARTRLEMMCGIKGKAFPEHYFRCCIIGAFINFYKSGVDWGRIYVETASDTNRNTRITLNYYLKGRLRKPEMLTRGDEIAIVADINVTAKDYELEDGSIEKRKFENLYAEDVVIVNEGDGETIPLLA